MALFESDIRMLNCSISGKGETIRTKYSVMSPTRQGSNPLNPNVPQWVQPPKTHCTPI